MNLSLRVVVMCGVLCCSSLFADDDSRVFRAGAFVVYARPDPAIMTGLRRWMSLKANRSVAVAPLSTVMRKLARN